jgi:hypothetical protein
VDNHGKDYFSSCLPVKYEVIRDWYLTPYFIYVNDVPKLNSGTKIKYADGTSVTNVGMNLKQLGKATTVNIAKILSTSK